MCVFLPMAEMLAHSPRVVKPIYLNSRACQFGAALLLGSPDPTFHRIADLWLSFIDSRI